MRRGWVLLLLAGAPAEERTWEVAEAGFRVTAPADWTGGGARDEATRTYRFSIRGPGGSLTVVARDHADGRIERRGGAPVSERSLDVDGEPAVGARYAGGLDEVLVDRDEVSYSIASTGESRLASWRWLPFPHRSPPARVAYEPVAGRVAILVPEDSDETFLSAIPIAARLNRGRPVVLAIGEKMSESVERFLRRYRPTVIAIGLKADAPGRSVCRASELWENPRRVVRVRSVAEAVLAAPLAARLGCPLAFSDDEFPGAEAIAPSAESADFVAVANSKSANAVLAAALAAARGGTVALVDDEVRTVYSELRESTVRPPGVDESRNGIYLAGEILGVPVTVPALGARAWGDPFFDGRRRLFGETVEIEGRRWSVVERLDRSQVGLVSPPAADVQRRLLAAYGRLPKHVAIVATTAEVPFHYTRSEYYFLAQGSTSPVMAGDSAYGNADDDPELEIAVGRLPLERRDDGSAAVATAVAHDEIALPPRAVCVADSEALRPVERELGARGFSREEATLERVRPEIARSTLIFYESHARPEFWSFGAQSLVPRWRGRIFRTPPPGIADIPELDGEPFVFCGGCLSGGVDLGSGFPAEFLRRGAVAYVGNTRLSVTSMGPVVVHAVQRMRYAGASVGEALREGRNRLRLVADEALEESPYGTREQHLESFETLTLFGDPSVRPALSAPEPIETVAWSVDETKMRVRVKWTGEGNPLLSLPAPDGARSASVTGAARGWALADGRLLLESERQADLEIEFSNRAVPPRRRTLDRAAFRLVLPSDEWKPQSAEGGIYVADATRPLNSVLVAHTETPGYTADTFLERRPADFRKWFPDSSVVGSGRTELAGRAAPYLDYDVAYPDFGRYRAREIFLGKVLVTLYQAWGCADAGWTARALEMLRGLALKP